MRIARYRTHLLIALLCLPALLLLSVGSAFAQNIVVLVNDEPITTFDIAQRQRWMVRTSGYGERMKAELTGDGIKQRFRQMMIAANPRSQAEAEQVAERIKKQLVEDAKRRVLSGGNDSSRKAAIDSLIEDKLKLQAAKKQSITISDAEVEETLAQRASGGGATASTPKAALAEFYAQFEADGISRKTIQDVIRAQLAWRDLIRKQYGPRIASLMAAASSNEQKPEESELQFDVRILRLAVSNSGDQKAVSQRLLEAENLREKFTSCKDLPREATLITQATVKTLDKAKLAAFPKDVQPLIVKASEGQMTPPVLVHGAVESYAICRKGVVAKAKPAEQKPDVRQQEYERFSRRYLQELKQSASIDYRGS